MSPVLHSCHQEQLLPLDGTNGGVKLKLAGWSASGTKVWLCVYKQETCFVLFAYLAKRKSQEVMQTQCVDAAIPLWPLGKPGYHSRSKEKKKDICLFFAFCFFVILLHPWEAPIWTLHHVWWYLYFFCVFCILWKQSTKKTNQTNNKKIPSASDKNVRHQMSPLTLTLKAIENIYRVAAVTL